MLNRKLFEVITHMPAAERKRLRQFLVSPYFNQGTRASDIVRLYDRMLKYNVNEAHPALSKKAVFEMLYPGKVFQEKVKGPVDTLTTELFGLIRRFLGQLEMEEEGAEVAEHLALAKFYRKYSYEDRFWKSVETIRALTKDAPLRDTIHYLWQHRIEEEVHLFKAVHNSFDDDANLDAVHKNLDLFYSIQKLEYGCSLIYQKQSAQVDTSQADPLLELVLDLSEEGKPLGVPINRIYRLLAQALQNPEEPSLLESMEALIQQYERQIDSGKLKNLKAFVRFLSVREYRKSGGDSALRHTFDIFREHLDRGYLYMDQQIPFTSLRNLVIISLKLGEYGWTKKFLDAHGPEKICGTRYPAEVHSLNMAEYYFYLKQYDKALQVVVYRLFENPTISIAVDLLIIKIYYETQNDLLEMRMKALDQKIRRSKLSRETKNRYHNFLKKLDKIARYGWQNDTSKRAKWVEEIKNTTEIVAKEWLLEQLT